MGMSDPRNHVHDITIVRLDERQGLNHVFDAFVWRQQAKREHDDFPFRAEAVLVKVRVDERNIGYSVRNQADFVLRDAEDLLQYVAEILAHHNHAVRQTRDLVHHQALIGIWLSQYRMQRRHDGHVKSAQQF